MDLNTAVVGNFIEEFRTNWLWRGIKLIQIGVDDGEVNQYVIIPASLETVTGKPSLGCGVKGDDIPEGNYLHIKAVGLSKESRPIYNQVLIEFGGNTLSNIRKDMLTLISDNEIVCFLRGAPEDIQRLRNTEGMEEYLRKLAVNVQGNDNIPFLQ